MDYRKIMSLKGDDLEKALEFARTTSWKNLGKKIFFYAPSFVNYRNSYFNQSSYLFPSISITGSSCTLRCKHCNGKILKTMIPAKTPDDLYNQVIELKNEGAVGCLISGGCLADGSVPLDKFVNAISRIKKGTEDFIVAVHTGIINSSTARKLKEAGVNTAMIDVIGSDRTIREIYGMKSSVKDIERSLAALSLSDIPTVPHILVGIHNGHILGETCALDMVAKYPFPAVIIIAFTPIHGTPMQNITPSKPEDVAKILVLARHKMPKTPIVLGCMRPKGESRVKTDIFAVKIGVNAIAFPTKEAVKLAQTMELDIKFSPFCCSQIFLDTKQ